MVASIRVNTISIYLFDQLSTNDAPSTKSGHLFAAMSFRFDSTFVEGFSSCPCQHFNASELQVTNLNKIFDVAQTCWGPHVFGLWWQLHGILKSKASEWGIDQVTCQIALSLFESALIDSYCKLRQKPFHKMLKDNSFGIDLAAMQGELAGLQPGDFLSDTISAINLQFPVKLNQKEPNLIAHAHHFKITLTGCPTEDYEALRSLAPGIEQISDDYRVSLDGACEFRTAEDFKLFWDLVTADSQLHRFIAHLIYVQEPFIQSITFDNQVLALFSEWPKRPPILLNVSDATFSALPKAIEHGYAGTTHSKLKGIFKGIANRCLLIARKHREPVGKYTMSGVGLVLADPIGGGQDLVVQACLGISDVSIQDTKLTPAGSRQKWPASALQAIFANPTEPNLGELNLHQGRLGVAQLLELPFGHSIESLPLHGSTAIYSS